MALRRDALRDAAADDSRDIANTTAGTVKGRMKAYQVKFPPAVMERFRAHCESKGLSLSAGTRLAVMQYMEKEGIR